MIKFSVSSFLSTLKDIVFSSSNSILFIIIGLLFASAMIISIKKKKTIGKKLFLIGWIFILLFVIIRYNSHLSILMDNLVNNVFMQLFFPNLATYIIIIILTNIIYLGIITKPNKKNYEKIISTIFFSSIMFMMIYTLDEIITNNLNIYSEEIYKNQNILVLIEATTITFTVWATLLIGKTIITKLINLSTNKVNNNYHKEAQIEETTDKENIENNSNIENREKVHIISTRVYHFKKRNNEI